MKKALAIVWTLLLVACLLPPAHAVTQIVTGGGFTVECAVITPDDPNPMMESALCLEENHYEFSYAYSALLPVETGKFTEDAAMLCVRVSGFDQFKRLNATALKEVKIFINGQELQPNERLGFIGPQSGARTASVTFPVELGEQSRRETLHISMQSTRNGVDVVQNAEITLDLVNTETVKPEREARILDIRSLEPKLLDAYIVGDRIYLDYTSAAQEGCAVRITFGDEAGEPFSCITWAEGVLCKAGTAALRLETETRLENSASEYLLSPDGCREEVRFLLETQAYEWRTSKYDVVVREHIPQPDPKGVYFAQSEHTLAVGERFTPVVMGVATGRAVTPDALLVGAGASAEVIDIDAEEKSVIGTRAGVAYITASYRPGGTEHGYETASMKITVTPGRSVPPEGDADATVVLCRRLNVRSGAGTEHPVLRRAHRGEVLQVVSIAQGWARLTDGSFVCARYIAR